MCMFYSIIFNIMLKKAPVIFHLRGNYVSNFQILKISDINSVNICDFLL